LYRKEKDDEFKSLEGLSRDGLSPICYPPAFSGDFRDQFKNCLSLLYRNKRVAAIRAINNAISLTQGLHPCEYTSFLVLRCMADVEEEIRVTPYEILNRNQACITQPEGNVLSRTMWTYQITHERPSMTVEHYYRNMGNATTVLQQELDFLRGLVHERDGIKNLCDGAELSDIQVSLVFAATHL
jgi:hypothetical protein